MNRRILIALVLLLTVTPMLSAWADTTVPDDTVLVQSILLSSNGMTLSEGESAQVTAVVSPENATDPSLTWESTNPDVIGVSPDGVITAVGQGGCMVFVTSNDGGAMATLYTAVGDVEPHDEVFVTNAAPPVLVPGETRQLQVACKPEGDAPKVMWQSSNEEVASVDDAGVVTAHQAGVASIMGTTGTYFVTGRPVQLGLGVLVTDAPIESREALTRADYIMTMGMRHLTWAIRPSRSWRQCPAARSCPALKAALPIWVICWMGLPSGSTTNPAP